MGHQSDAVIRGFMETVRESMSYELRHDENRRYLLFRPLYGDALFLRKVYVMVSNANAQCVSRFNVSEVVSASGHGLLCISVARDGRNTGWLFTKAQLGSKRWLRLTPNCRKYLNNEIFDAFTSFAGFYNDTVLSRLRIIPSEQLMQVVGTSNMFAISTGQRLYVLRRLASV